MNNAASMVIFVERKAANFFNRFLVKCPRTNEVKRFSCVTDAANFVERLEALAAFDSKDRIVVMSEGETPELGIHFSRCANF